MVIIGGDPVNDLQPPLPARPRLQQHAFREMVDLVLWIGLLFTLVMGRLGGLVPALSAMRMEILESLR